MEIDVFYAKWKNISIFAIAFEREKTIWRTADNKTETNNPSQMSANKSILLYMVMICIVL